MTTSTDQPSLPHVLVIGAGFGGIELCKRLRNAPVRISLVDRRNHHLFQPLLYQVASAALSPADIAHPIRTIFRAQANLKVYLAEASSVNLAQRCVYFADGKASYDFLVLAAGATHSYFGNDNWNEEAPGLKSLEDAIEIRKRILLAFEEAEYEPDEQSRRKKLTFVIVGGGPTGVELAGALKEIAVETIPDDFRNIDTKTARVILVQSGERLLPAFPESLSARALADLQRMGVEVRLNSRATAISEKGLNIGDEFLSAENIFWAAGVQGSPLGKTLGVPLDGNGRVIVEADLSISGYPEVFVLGDMSSAKSWIDGTQVPGVAQAAIQGGAFVAERILSLIENNTKQPTKFRYKDKGNLATIGKAKAVADIKGLHFGGLLAWILWSLVHVVVLVGFRNRFFVVITWIWNYLLSSRGARLITGPIRSQSQMFYETSSDTNRCGASPAKSRITVSS